jgi:hypothetical protein
MSREKWLDVAAGSGVTSVVVLTGALLGAWTGFPKGVDAANHLTRLKFVADWFPHYNWLYAWAAGMPTFDNYPGLAYVVALPLVVALGPETTLKLLALLAMVAFGLGLFGHLRLRGANLRVALIATLMALTSMSVWQFITYDGVYARVIAMGLGALAWWAHAGAIRNASGRLYSLTALLLALTVAAHPVTGAFAAGYVVLVQLAAQGWSGIRAVMAIAAISLCLAAQPVTSPLTIGIGGRILGVDRPELSITVPTMIVDPLFLGFAALTIPVLTVLVALRRRPRAAIAGAAALLVVLAYIFAPNFGIPTRYYYINGIDPNTVPYFLAIVGALVFGLLAPSLAGRGRIFVGFAALVIVANAVVAVPGMLSSPYVADTSATQATETIARRTLVVDGNDLEHRILPLSAAEAVWFNYIYRKPQLRDYYTFGLLNPDWLFWVFDSIYHPPLNRARIEAIFDWYALDSFTVSTVEEKVEPVLPQLGLVSIVPSTKGTDFRQYAYSSPTAIVALTSAPLVVVVGSTTDYDHVARLLFDEGASPRTRVPVSWSGTLADLPDELAGRAASVVVVGDRLGDRTSAQQVVETLTRHGATVLWDLAGVGDATLPGPWPVTQVSRAVFDRWDVTDRESRIIANDFSPASFEGGPWGAAVPTAAQPGAIVELSLGGRPVVVSAQHNTGSLVVVGANLLYHAQSKANAAERRYLLSFITASARDAEREPTWRFVHPERREIETDGSPVLLKESLYPKWHAHLVSPIGPDRPLRIFYAGPGLMLVLPAGPGTVVFDYGGTLPLGWAAWVVTLLGVVFAFVLGRRKDVFVVLPRSRDPVEDDE